MKELTPEELQDLKKAVANAIEDQLQTAKAIKIAEKDHIEKCQAFWKCIEKRMKNANKTKILP